MKILCYFFCGYMYLPDLNLGKCRTDPNSNTISGSFINPYCSWKNIHVYKIKPILVTYNCNYSIVEQIEKKTRLFRQKSFFSFIYFISADENDSLKTTVFCLTELNQEIGNAVYLRVLALYLFHTSPFVVFPLLLLYFLNYKVFKG